MNDTFQTVPPRPIETDKIAAEQPSGSGATGSSECWEKAVSDLSTWPTTSSCGDSWPSRCRTPISTYARQMPKPT